MPSSQPWRISPIAEFIYRLHPKSVLDIGIGFGKWGVLAREYTDVNKGRCAKNLWQIRIEGIEIFAPYENPLWSVYNKVHVGDAVEVLSTLGNYDLILAVEILEHMQRPNGLKMIEMIKAKSKDFVVSYSNSVSPGMFGNPREEHVSKWLPKDFEGCKLLCERDLSQVYVGKGKIK